MTNSTADQLVDQYLARLADAAQRLPADRRDELLSEIREHIAASGAGGAGADEAAVRTMLDRLGEPADIVAAALDDGTHPANLQTAQGPRRGLGLEIGAVVMLTAGSLIPVVGWVIGLVLLWSSGVWSRSEKLLGSLIFPGGPAVALILVGMPAQTCTSGAASGVTVLSGSAAPAVSGPVMATAEVCTGLALSPWFGVPVLLLVLIGPVVVGIILINRARKRI